MSKEENNNSIDSEKQYIYTVLGYLGLGGLLYIVLTGTRITKV